MKRVHFRNDSTKTLFPTNEIKDVITAHKAMVVDFRGSGYDMNFEMNEDGLYEYMKQLTSTDYENFSDIQKTAIKENYSL